MQVVIVGAHAPLCHQVSVDGRLVGSFELGIAVIVLEPFLPIQVVNLTAFHFYIFARKVAIGFVCS